LDYNSLQQLKLKKKLLAQIEKVASGII